MLRIWVDADACPQEVKEIIIRAATKRKVQAIFVANKFLRFQPSEFVSFVQVMKGADVADTHIAEQATQEDIVITQDIPLASQVVKKGILAINPRGELYTESNIAERLSIRDFMTELRSTGVQTGGPRAYDQKAKNAFANSLDALLTRKLKVSTPKT